MKKVLVLFGTRPEAIKMAPLVHELKEGGSNIDVRVCVTAQHREMLDQVLDFFEIDADFDLNLMTPGQNLSSLTAAIISSLQNVFENFAAEYVFVHGDTTTAMAGSIAAFYFGAKVMHIEAGLRTYNKLAPFPEEINRQIIGRIADYHFAPTIIAKNNLLAENIPEERIIITGNTVIDALFMGLGRIENNPTQNIIELEEKLFGKDIVLVTGHRRENQGVGFINICEALKQIALERPEILIVYPVHLNPKVLNPVNMILGDIRNILLINPLPYQDFLWLMHRSKLIITDSGGIQEEAPSLGIPVLVMRETTERPEAVDAGTVLLVGSDRKKIYSETLDLLDNKERYSKMSQLHNPYGDGRASKKITDFFINLFT